MKLPGSATSNWRGIFSPQQTSTGGRTIEANMTFTYILVLKQNLHSLNEMSFLNVPSLSGLIWLFRFHHTIFTLEYSVFFFILLNVDACIP
jgi:hypothetical protein